MSRFETEENLTWTLTMTFGQRKSDVSRARANGTKNLTTRIDGVIE